MTEIECACGAQLCRRCCDRDMASGLYPKCATCLHVGPPKPRQRPRQEELFDEKETTPVIEWQPLSPFKGGRDL